MFEKFKFFSKDEKQKVSPANEDRELGVLPEKFVDEEQEDESDTSYGLNRREFLKRAGVGAAAIAFEAACASRPGTIRRKPSRLILKTLAESSHIDKRLNRNLPDDYWFKIFENIVNQDPNSPILSEASDIRDSLGIPGGECAAIGPVGKLEPGAKPGTFATNPAEFAKATERERIIWEKLASHPGVLIDSKRGMRDFGKGFFGDASQIISIDPRDTVFQDGQISEDLKNALGPDVSTILEIKIKERQRIIRQYGDTKSRLYVDRPIHFFRLPGGATIIPVGYRHTEKWHKRHGEHIAKISHYAEIIAIEGYLGTPYGESLIKYWKGSKGHYDALMHEATEAGFKGLFVEIDPRDSRRKKALMDNIKQDVFPNLSKDFFSAYGDYLRLEDPEFFKQIQAAGGLEFALRAQATTKEARSREESDTFQRGIGYHAHQYLTKDKKTSFSPTGLELGEHLFADAVSAIRLHMMARLQAEGKIPMGPILDIEGSNHLPAKNFFIRYPIYAMMVILRNPHFALVHTLKDNEGVEDVIKFFQNPDLTEILHKLGDLPFHRVEEAPGKSVEPGPNQRLLVPESQKPMNFFDELGIDLAIIVQKAINAADVARNRKTTMYNKKRESDEKKKLKLTKSLYSNH